MRYGKGRKGRNGTCKMVKITDEASNVITILHCFECNKLAFNFNGISRTFYDLLSQIKKERHIIEKNNETRNLKEICKNAFLKKCAIEYFTDGILISLKSLSINSFINQFLCYVFEKNYLFSLCPNWQHMFELDGFCS